MRNLVNLSSWQELLEVQEALQEVEKTLILTTQSNQERNLTDINQLKVDTFKELDHRANSSINNNLSQDRKIV